uniref:Uncharacterized protein n=1 Tax=Amphimedon queenslandica TaxID=400682 RepID=A0A1X7T8U3_AMPQE
MDEYGFSQGMFSLEKRMNRSVQPLPYINLTKDGDDSIPDQRLSSWRARLTDLRPVVVADGQTGRHALVDHSESVDYPLANGPQHFEARTSLGGVQSDAVGREMVDGHEDGN